MHCRNAWERWEHVPQVCPQVCCAESFEYALHGQLGLPAEGIHLTGNSPAQCHRARLSLGLRLSTFFNPVPVCAMLPAELCRSVCGHPSG